MLVLQSWCVYETMLPKKQMEKPYSVLFALRSCHRPVLLAVLFPSVLWERPLSLDASLVPKQLHRRSGLEASPTGTSCTCSCTAKYRPVYASWLLTQIRDSNIATLGVVCWSTRFSDRLPAAVCRRDISTSSVSLLVFPGAAMTEAYTVTFVALAKLLPTQVFFAFME